jgi:5'(3')-deoxyribonucleotidase
MMAQEKLDELVQKEKEKEHRRLFTHLELIEHEAEAVAEVMVHYCVYI